MKTTFTSLLLLMTCVLMAQYNLSIYDLQYTTNPTGDSPWKDSLVTTHGIVTAVDTSGAYWIQDGDSAWSGLYVYDNTNFPAEGDSITISGTLSEYFGLTELKTITSFVTNSTGNPVPSGFPETTLNARQEKYESVLMKVNSATCTDPNVGFGQWVVNDGSDTLLVDDLLYPYSPTMSAVYNITGLMYYSFSEWKLEPRYTPDIITITSGPVVSIGDIQYNPGIGGASPYDGQTVNTKGIVTAVYSQGYFIQDGDSAWSGLHVFDSNNTPARGDSISLTGNVSEFFNMTQLSSISNFTVLSSGNPEPAPIGIQAADVSLEQWEGVLVKVSNTTCTNDNVAANFGEWTITDASGSAQVDDLIFAYTPTLNYLYDVSGPIYYSYSVYKVEPRDLQDITETVGMSENREKVRLLVYPNPASSAITVSSDEVIEDISVIDARGRVVMHSEDISSARYHLLVDELTAGSYTLMIRSADAVNYRKLIIE